MANPNETDFWPRYAVFSDALMLSVTAARKHGVHDRPTLEWTREQVLLVALDTLREEANHERQREINKPPEKRE
jgi:hypothetical protein